MDEASKEEVLKLKFLVKQGIALGSRIDLPPGKDEPSTALSLQQEWASRDSMTPLAQISPSASSVQEQGRGAKVGGSSVSEMS